MYQRFQLVSYVYGLCYTICQRVQQTDNINAQNSKFGEMRRNDEKYRDKQRTERKWNTNIDIRIHRHMRIAHTILGKRQRRKRKKKQITDHTAVQAYEKYMYLSLRCIFEFLGKWQQKFTYIFWVFLLCLLYVFKTMLVDLNMGFGLMA